MRGRFHSRAMIFWMKPSKPDRLSDKPSYITSLFHVLTWNSGYCDSCVEHRPDIFSRPEAPDMCGSFALFSAVFSENFTLWWQGNIKSKYLLHNSFYFISLTPDLLFYLFMCRKDNQSRGLLKEYNKKTKNKKLIRAAKEQHLFNEEERHSLAHVLTQRTTTDSSGLDRQSSSQ